MSRLIDVARDVCMRIRDSGFEAYFVGGCVRDMLLGREPNDVDVATSALPDDIKIIFGDSTYAGKSFGVSRVRHDGFEFEVATFRSDGTYSDGRRPDNVTYSSLSDDIMRRDFTMNALMFDPIGGTIIDLVGGKDDIKDRVVRAVGDATKRFEEDKLRMLRAARFAVTLGFEIETDTFEAITKHASEISCVSRERITQELNKGICKNPAAMLDLLIDLKLFKHVFKTYDTFINAYLHGVRYTAIKTMSVSKKFKELSEFDRICAAYVILFRAESYEEYMYTLRDVLMLPNKHIKTIEFLIFELNSLLWTFGEDKEARLTEILTSDKKEIFLLLASCISDYLSIQLLEFLGSVIIQELIDPIDMTIIPNGDDLIARGIVPSLQMKRAISAARRAVLERSARTKVEALEIAIMSVE